MIVTKIIIDNFRNWNREELIFSSRGNIFFGNNGQGKTNLLEAIAFLQLGKSFRTSTDKEVVGFDKECFFIQGDFQENHQFKEKEILTQDSSVTIEYNKKEGKKIRYNQQYISKLSQLMGALNFVILSLEDRTISQGSPSSRRKFMDYSLAQTDFYYLESIQKMKRILIQKNYYLKESGQDHGLLKVLNEQLAVQFEKIIKKREEFLQAINPFFQEIYSGLNEEGEEAALFYKPDIQLKTKKEIEMYLNEKLIREKELKTSCYGVHRDDFDIEIQGKNSRQYASQGQHKSLIIALKMSLSKYYEKYFQKKAILLLDDIFSELDNSRIHLLLDLFCHFSQVFVTIPREDELKLLPSNFHIFQIQQGKIIS